MGLDVIPSNYRVLCARLYDAMLRAFTEVLLVRNLLLVVLALCYALAMTYWTLVFYGYISREWPCWINCGHEIKRV